MKRSLLLLALCVLLAVSSTLLAQGPPTPAAAPIINAAAVIQANANTGIELRLTAQLVQTTSHVAPFRALALPLASGGYVLTPAASAPSFTQSCALTNSNTMLECLLSPSPGPGWNNDNPLAVSVQLTGANGAVATTLVTFSGGASAFVSATLQAGTGLFPAMANSSPLYLSAQLIRNVINLTPIESSALTLSTFTLTEATASHPAVYTCALTISSTMLECTLTPTGLTWGAGGPIIVRVVLTSVDGAKATTLLTFRIN